MCAQLLLDSSASAGGRHQQARPTREVELKAYFSNSPIGKRDGPRSSTRAATARNLHIAAVDPRAVPEHRVSKPRKELPTPGGKRRRIARRTPSVGQR